MKRWLALAALLAASGPGCHGDQGPAGGELSLRLATPRNGDRAVMVVVNGRVRGASAPSGSGYRVFADTSADGDTAHVVVVAPRGSAVIAGEIARLRVEDTRKYRTYTARVLTAATATYDLADTVGLSVTIVKP